MNSKQLAVSAALVICTSTAVADVTVTMQTEGKASFINVGGEGVAQIKGKRQRNDQMVDGKTRSSLLDVDGLRFVSLDDKKKTAEVTPLAAVGESLRKAGVTSLQTSLTKTAQTKTIASYPCTVHEVNITTPFSPTGPGSGLDMTMVLSGTVCLSTSAPGLADYRAFYRAAADAGFIFGDPRSVKSPTGAAQAQAYAALVNKMAEAGMSLENHIMITAKGDSPLAGMMAKLAASDLHTTVTKISTDELPASSFDVPADYKVKMQK
jgi:hypothetical protein